MFLILIIITLALGFTISHFILKDLKDLKDINTRFLLNLSMPLGIGVSSVIFIYFNLFSFSSYLILFIELLVVVFFMLYQKSYRNYSTLLMKNASLNFNKLLLSPVLLVASILYFYSWIMDIGIFFFDSIQSPSGLWDAWSCWNLIARFISRAPDIWPELLHQMNPVDFHPDYPLLQRGFIAFGWLLTKDESFWIPIFSAFVFTFSTIGLLYSSVSLLSNKINGLIAGLILLCTPFFMIMGDSQYADTTVGFFYLATIVLLTFARKGQSNNPKLFIAAGITAGLAAWSKNEGLLFIVCLFASQLLLLFSKNFRELFKELKYIFIGMLPVLLLVAYQKFIIAPPNQIMSAQGASTFAKLTDYSRYTTVFEWFFSQFGTFGKWEINPWWFFLFGIMYKGFNIKGKNPSLLPNITLVFLMLSGFFFVEIITPLGLIYYLSTSVHRLFFQLFPAFIFVYFMAISNPSTYSIESLLARTRK